MPALIALLVAALVIGTGPIGIIILVFGIFCWGLSALFKDIERSAVTEEVVESEPKYMFKGKPVSYDTYLHVTPYEELSEEDQKIKRDIEVRNSINMSL